MPRMLAAAALCVAVFAAFGFAQAPATVPAAPPTLRVMSFNVRLDTPLDGRHGWPHRRPRVRELLLFHRPDVLGAQEALANQVAHLAEDLPDHKWVGVGREDGKAAGEFAPIFYDARRLELLDGGTFWLSETPERIGSVGWDAALPRVATWARLRDRATGTAFVALNTHFDHKGDRARAESARLIVERAAALARGGPVVVMGDFNALPTSAAYATLAAALRDARAEAGVVMGPEGTFGSFVAQAQAALPRIDYVFASAGVRVARFATLAQTWDGGAHASDHHAVMADVALP